MVQDGAAGPNPDDAAEYIRNIARQTTNEAFNEFKQYWLTEIMPKLPTQEGMVRETVATVSAKVASEVAGFSKRMERLEGLLGPAGATASQGGAAGAQSVKEIAIPGLAKPVDLAGWMAVVDYGLKTFLQLQEARIRMTDPFTLAAKLRAIDPVKAAIAGQLLYPNPMEQYAPALAGQVAQNTMRQGMSIFIPMLRDVARQATWPKEGASPGSTPSEGLPSWYGGPNAASGAGPSGPPPGSGTPSPGQATMNESQGRPGLRGNGQDTVRVSGQPGSRAILRGNFR